MTIAFIWSSPKRNFTLLPHITILLVCQLAGEVIARLAGLPVPGPIIGMVLLFAGLLIRGGLPQGLETVANTFLSHLSLLFIPAGVGIMVHLKLLAREWLAISVALAVSTAMTIAVTGWVAQRLTRRRNKQP